MTVALLQCSYYMLTLPFSTRRLTTSVARSAAHDKLSGAASVAAAASCSACFSTASRLSPPPARGPDESAGSQAASWYSMRACMAHRCISAPKMQIVA